MNKKFSFLFFDGAAWLMAADFLLEILILVPAGVVFFLPIMCWSKKKKSESKDVENGEKMADPMDPKYATLIGINTEGALGTKDVDAYGEKGVVRDEGDPQYETLNINSQDAYGADPHDPNYETFAGIK